MNIEAEVRHTFVKNCSTVTVIASYSVCKLHTGKQKLPWASVTMYLLRVITTEYCTSGCWLWILFSSYTAAIAPMAVHDVTFTHTSCKQLESLHQYYLEHVVICYFIAWVSTPVLPRASSYVISCNNMQKSCILKPTLVCALQNRRVDFTPSVAASIPNNVRSSRSITLLDHYRATIFRSKQLSWPMQRQ